MTALHYMAKFDGAESLRLLLHHGAEINLANNVRRKIFMEHEVPVIFKC